MAKWHYGTRTILPGDALGCANHRRSCCLCRRRPRRGPEGYGGSGRGEGGCAAADVDIQNHPVMLGSPAELATFTETPRHVSTEAAPLQRLEKRGRGDELGRPTAGQGRGGVTIQRRRARRICPKAPISRRE